jgi:hypothetical protein
MKYYLPKANRTIELDDKLVEEYCKHDSLRENTFFVAFALEYGRYPTQEEMSDDEFTKACNELLCDDIKTLELLPQALEVINSNREEWHKKAVNGELTEIDCSLRTK